MRGARGSTGGDGDVRKGARKTKEQEAGGADLAMAEKTWKLRHWALEWDGAGLRMGAERTGRRVPDAMIGKLGPGLFFLLFFFTFYFLRKSHPQGGHIFTFRASSRINEFIRQK